MNRRTPIHLPPRHPLERQPIIFLTVATDKRKPILCSDPAHQLIIQDWKKADQWFVGRYVIMPDHIHLFCSPAQWEVYPLARWVRYWKSLVSRHWLRPEEQPIWQRSFWDTQLRTEERYQDKWAYVQLNPVRKGYCTDPKDWAFQGELNELKWFD